MNIGHLGSLYIFTGYTEINTCYLRSPYVCWYLRSLSQKVLLRGAVQNGSCQRGRIRHRTCIDRTQVLDVHVVGANRETACVGKIKQRTAAALRPAAPCGCAIASTSLSMRSLKNYQNRSHILNIKHSCSIIWEFPNIRGLNSRALTIRTPTKRTPNYRNGRRRRSSLAGLTRWAEVGGRCRSGGR